MDKLKIIAGKLAPKIQEALAGPLQGQMLAMIFARMKVSTVEEVENKLETDVKSLGQLKDAEQDYINATSAPSKVAGASQKTLVSLTYIYNVGYFLLLGLFIYFTFGVDILISEWVKGIMGTLIGVLTAQLPTINGYWFGSSAGSRAKTEALVSQNDKG
jgi:hypothetical protein